METNSQITKPDIDLHGWDDGKIYLWNGSQEVCVNDYPDLLDNLTKMCEKFFAKKNAHSGKEKSQSALQAKKRSNGRRAIKTFNRIPMKEIRAVAKKIVKNFDVEKIILFGSYAYGSPTEHSDVDLLVVMDHDKQTNRQQLLEISRAISPRPFPMDMIVRTPRQIQERVPQGDYFLKGITENGKVLYQRSQNPEVRSKKQEARRSIF
jgi:predicted nucleotidyltransferase